MAHAVKELEKIFGGLNQFDAQRLLGRLAVRRDTDNLSKAFHDALSMPTINKLLDVLRKAAQTDYAVKGIRLVISAMQVDDTRQFRMRGGTVGGV